MKRELTPDEKNQIDSAMQKAVYEAFDAIYVKVEHENVAPSEIARFLDLYWDMGDFYREWWETDDEGEWS